MIQQKQQRFKEQESHSEHPSGLWALDGRDINVIHGRAVHTGERSTYGEYYEIMAYSNTKEYINIKN